jgi:hypothetical protein
VRAICLWSRGPTGPNSNAGLRARRTRRRHRRSCRRGRACARPPACRSARPVVLQFMHFVRRDRPADRRR